MSALKIVFAGTPGFAARHLDALLSSGHNVAAVYTQPDRAAGRGKSLHASPVKELALKHNIPVYQPQSLKSDEAQAELAKLGADLMIVVAYGLLLPKAVLEIPARGCINVHASLLPRWRGAAPIERALLAGDSETGITIMQMDVGLDTGDMLYTLSTPISASDDRVSLENRLADLGCQALLHTLGDFDTLQAKALAQDDAETTYAKKIDKTEALINWASSAESIGRTVRASIGRNPAYSFLQGQRLRVLKARPVSGSHKEAPGTILEIVRTDSKSPAFISVACGNGILMLEELQLPGKNPASVRELLNSYSSVFTAGNCFSDQENT
ncbi:MAG: methionyl-tRNA formyltransferase [Pseudohongiella sp.]|nr:methionyl-tRNA formyltransferase [Pseudohongiella sp.]